MTEPTQDLAARRRDIVRAVADLSKKHNLPMPSISFEPIHDSIHLHLDRNSADAVERWSEVLHNGPVNRKILGKGDGAFIDACSDKHPHDGPTWFGAGRVHIDSFSDVPRGGPE